MPGFDDIRDELTIARSELEGLREQSLLAHEAVRRAEQAGDDDDLQSARRFEAELNSRLADQLKAEATLLGKFAEFSDPRKHVGLCADHHPILLLPLRLETRFKTSEAGTPQLWVRVYPDTCLIDTFEPSLTEQEVENAGAFWARMWRAAGDEALERAAWRELAAAHGSGRSGWIVKRYVPLNPGQRPDGSVTADVHLIITAPDLLPDEVLTYWEDAWRADGDATRLALAQTALESALGAQGARDAVERSRPFNFDDAPEAPLTRATARVKATVVRLRPAAEMEARRTSWSSPARIDILPDRFVVVAYPPGGEPVTELGEPIRTPIVASPDPGATAEEALRQVGDKLHIPDDIAWMFDFDRAVEAGMALRVDITPEQARAGFDRVLVLGVRLHETPEQGAESLSTLLEHHLHSRSGLEILPQGTPTNNTEQDGAGYSFREDPDATFDIFVREHEQYDALEADPLRLSDGHWLAHLLGLSHALVQRIPNAGGTDQADARAMQIALWRGTLGYTMSTLLEPVFSDGDVAFTREFFTRHVTGRGAIPALRIGRQPYGIMLAAAFDHLNWFEADRVPSRARRLYGILRQINEDLEPLARRVSRLGQETGDPRQTLLDVIGLHPSSVEYHPLKADSVDHKFHELSFFDFALAQQVLRLFPPDAPMTLLRRLGYAGERPPDLLKKLFKRRQTPLDGPLVDDRPISEHEEIRAYAGERNYIDWLADAADEGIEVLQQQRGFDGGHKPAALLYLLLRHALQLGFRETAVKLQLDAGVISDPGPARREPPFVHVAEAAEVSESTYEALFRVNPEITGSEGMRLGDYIARNIPLADPQLHEQIQALRHLARLPTAKLERAFAEHVDCCSYRLDAWKAGVLATHLERLRRPRGDGPVGRAPAGARRPAPQEPGPITGLHLGAFGWLEPLRPAPRGLSPAKLEDGVAQEVNKDEAAPLMSDQANAGLIHAPSLNHATTAAVLRNGYLANGGRLAVNLSSQRTRLALEILEGVRHGQSVGALLGYRFERHLHDHGPLGVRDLVYPLRRQFPLAANQIAGAGAESGEPQDSIAAMNVVDGRRLVEHVEGTDPAQATYPFGLSSLPRRSPAQEQAVTAALDHVRDVNDALADLALAEGVHQAVLGNYDRSAAVMDAFAKGAHPPDPEVVRTPRSGIALTLRAAIHLPTAPPANPLGYPLTPLARAEPAVNAWLRDRLPAPGRVGCHVAFTDRATNSEKVVFVDQSQLGLHPADLVHRVHGEAEQALDDLDEQILRHVQTQHAPRHDRPIVIRHTERVPGGFTWFELQALLRSIRSLLASRPLQPADLMGVNDSSGEEQPLVSLPRQRITAPRDDLVDTLLPALDALASVVGDNTITIDAALERYAETIARLAAYRLPQTGSGFVHEWRASTYTALAEKLAARVKRWNKRLDAFDARLAEYDLLPAATPAEERVAALARAELIVSTALTLPAPPDPADYRLVVLPARRDAFVAKRDALWALVTTPSATLAALLASAAAEVPVAAFDSVELDLSEARAEVERFRTELSARVAAVREELLQRTGRVDALLAAHDSAAAGDQRVRLLQDAATELFGEGFRLVPHVTLPAEAASNLADAWQHSVSGGLTQHLTGAGGRDFPVDDWLHGVARVRPKMRDWENVTVLADVIPGTQASELTPLQLPSVPGEPWLAMEFPPDHEITSDRLLYTAHFSEPFETADPVCGLLVDEWTEVLPASQETTGLAFHYNRPNAEAPQSWLLALPAASDGSWSWEDLLAVVNDTLDSARRRAIEPDHLGDTPYAWFLPATMSAYTFPEISISNNLLHNVAIHEQIKKGPS